MPTLSQAVEIIDALQEAQEALYARGDVTGVRRMLPDDVEWYVPGRSAIAGHYHGIDAVIDYFLRRRRMSGGTFRMHREAVLAGEGPYVAAVTRGVATISGRWAEWRTVGLYELRGSQVARCWLLSLDPEKFDALWSAAGDGTS